MKIAILNKNAIVYCTHHTRDNELSVASNYFSGNFTSFAVNYGASIYPQHLNYICSHHAEYMADFLNKRQESGLNTADVVCISVYRTLIPGSLNFGHLKYKLAHSGSSALFAVQCALQLGAENVIIVGCQLDGPYKQFRKGWLSAIRRHDFNFTRVRAVSGWLSEILGVPDDNWLR